MVVTPDSTWRQHSSDVTCVEMSNCGSYVVSGSGDGDINIWMWDTRRVILSIRGGHSGKGILEVVIPPEITENIKDKYLPSGVEFITMGRDGCIRFWSVFETTNEEVTDLKNDVLNQPKYPIISLRQLMKTASSGATKSDEVFKAPVLPNPNSDYGDQVTSTTSYSSYKRGNKSYSVQPVGTLWHSSFSFCRIKLAVSADGSLCTLVAPANEGIMRVYSLWGGQPTDYQQMQRKFHPLHEALQECYRGSEDDLPVKFLRDLLPLKGHPVGVCMTFDCCDPDWSVVGYESGDISLYNQSEMVAMQKISSEPVMAISIIEKERNSRYAIIAAGPEEHLIISGYTKKSETLTQLSQIKLPTKGCSSISFHPSNKNIFCATCWDGTASVYNIKTGKHIALLDAHTKSCLASTWQMAKGKAVLITSSGDTTICIWFI